MDVVFTITLSLLAAALVLAFVRLARGPSLPDRVIALDLISIIIAAMIATGAIWLRQTMLLDAVTVVAVVSFFGTVAIARYLERKSSDEK